MPKARAYRLPKEITMTQRRSPLLAFVVCALTLGAAAFAQPASQLTVVTSFSVLEDFARQVAGEDADVRVLAPVGAEVHEWELVPQNFIDLEEAEVFLYNGYNLEEWLAQAEATLGEDALAVAVAEETGYETLPILLGDFEGEPDPHLWMDPRAAMRYVEVIRDVLAEADPENAATYEAKAAAYLAELEGLYDEIDEQLQAIPAENRLLISSEAAFLYFADAFDFEHDGIWGSNAEEEGTPEQLVRIVELVREREPAALFWESTISDRYVQSVADETGTPVVGPLYVDSLGEEGSGAESYLGLQRTNAALLVETLR
jgi:manganese/iron transport system substrate-binding protein